MMCFKGILVSTLAVLSVFSSALAGEYDLTIEQKTFNFTGRERPAIAINGSIPGPTLRWREGEDVTVRVTNRLPKPTSIHWHGLLVPADMDGVPGLSFAGIAPGETFIYRFTIQQSGTYWYHSHSGLQEQSGVYGPIVIDPPTAPPDEYDREYVVMLSDWTDEDPHRVLANLKKQSDYYNRNKRTVFDFFRDVGENGWNATVSDRLDWGTMRMDPTDIADVSGYTFLVNGQPPAANWTALFNPGERVRLRFINGSAMSIFDVRIPGLRMQVVQADGQDVAPVTVDAFRIAVAETYDVIVEPRDDRAYTVFAESIDRSGYARATLAPRPGMTAEIPALQPRQILTMADMGAAHGGMAGAPHQMPADEPPPQGPMAQDRTAATDHSAMGHGAPAAAAPPAHQGHSAAVPPPPAHQGHGAAAEPAPAADDRMTPASDAPKTLSYADLRAVVPNYDTRAPGREIVIRLTGNMERYIWSIDDKKFSEAEPINLRFGERVRLRFVNETMMNHPMHLHGMWMELDNGNGAHNPRKHTVNVPPGQTVDVDVTADAVGQWAFHCHLLYHMESGMFRTVVVADVAAPTQ